MSTKTIADQIIRSLRDDPEQWEFDDFEARHPSGLSVWIANGHYGLNLKFEGMVIYGGVTALSWLFGWAMPTRRRLLSAVRGTVREQATVAFAKGRAALTKEKTDADDR